MIVTVFTLSTTCQVVYQVRLLKGFSILCLDSRLWSLLSISSKFSILSCSSNGSSMEENNHCYRLKVMLTIRLVLLLGTCSAITRGNVTFPDQYRKFKRPLLNQSETMEVSVGLIIAQIFDIDFRNSDLYFNLAFYMRWKDELIDISDSKDGKTEVDNYSGIWCPDLYIYNLIKFRMYTSDFPFPHLVLSKEVFKFQIK